MIIDTNFNSGGVHLQVFAEGTVDGLDDVGLSCAFGTRSMLVTGQDGVVGFPLVGEVSAVPLVAPEQLLPEATGCGGVLAAWCPASRA